VDNSTIIALSLHNYGTIYSADAFFYVSSIDILSRFFTYREGDPKAFTKTIVNGTITVDGGTLVLKAFTNSTHTINDHLQVFGTLSIDTTKHDSSAIVIVRTGIDDPEPTASMKFILVTN
jgi:hypothetical protein